MFLLVVLLQEETEMETDVTSTKDQDVGLSYL